MQNHCLSRVILLLVLLQAVQELNSDEKKQRFAIAVSQQQSGQWDANRRRQFVLLECDKLLTRLCARPSGAMDQWEIDLFSTTLCDGWTIFSQEPWDGAFAFTYATLLKCQHGTTEQYDMDHFFKN